MSSILRIAVLQYDILWEQPESNRTRITEAIDSFMHGAGKGTDIVILPEFFTTGFTMNKRMAEKCGGDTLSWMKDIAAKYDIALAGSIPVEDGGSVFNRHFFVTQGGDIQHYDKRHLFRMSDENKVFAAGNKRMVVEYKGWNIALNTCYDIRFPVWSRNVGQEYDLMINVASWPDSRIEAARILAKARAIENICYYIFANRAGDSPVEHYSGGSMVVDYKGCECGRVLEVEEWKNGFCFMVSELDKEALGKFREKFPAWMDADGFELAGICEKIR